MRPIASGSLLFAGLSLGLAGLGHAAEENVGEAGDEGASAPLSPQEEENLGQAVDRDIGPVNPYMDTTIPGVGSVLPSVVQALSWTDEELASVVNVQQLFDLIFYLNEDLMASLPDDYATLPVEEQFRLQHERLREAGYPASLLEADIGQPVSRAFFARLFYEMLGGNAGQVDCVASLRASGRITQPEGIAVTLTDEEIVACLVQEGVMSSEDPLISGLEIRDILATSGLDWRRPLDPGAAPVVEPVESSLEAVFLRPLSPTEPESDEDDETTGD